MPQKSCSALKPEVQCLSMLRRKCCASEFLFRAEARSASGESYHLCIDFLFSEGSSLIDRYDLR
jgi:hypothetical protein